MTSFVQTTGALDGLDRMVSYSTNVHVGGVNTMTISRPKKHGQSRRDIRGSGNPIYILLVYGIDFLA